jgi:hypothetical protein
VGDHQKSCGFTQSYEEAPMPEFVSRRHEKWETSKAGTAKTVKSPPVGFDSAKSETPPYLAPSERVSETIGTGPAMLCGICHERAWRKVNGQTICGVCFAKGAALMES